MLSQAPASVQRMETLVDCVERLSGRRVKRHGLWCTFQTRPFFRYCGSPHFRGNRPQPCFEATYFCLRNLRRRSLFCLRNERQENTQDYFDFGFICRGTNYCKHVDLDSSNPDRWNKPHYRHRESRRANRSQVSFSGTERRPLSHCFFRRILGTGRLSRWDRTEPPPKYARASCSSRSAVLRASRRTALEFVMETSAR